MKFLTSAEIRKKFLDFFQSKNHQIVPSAPIIVKNDPTLMFTNAGMNQFKDYFLGNKQAPFPRVVDTQKCLRVSGKHNDLEEVGVDTFHHTMFEMLGNWSFGNPENPAEGYFKKEAIEWSWELLTKELGISEDRLYVTIFEGNALEGIEKDTEAIEEWSKWIDPQRILPFGKKDNFWEMGDTGPCGPCTEIHVDTRSDEERQTIDGKELVNMDHPQVIEIWNNVFIQYNRLKDGSLNPLPAKHVDTGMGFERLVRVLQQKGSNYDTDIFSGTINKIEEITNKKYDQSEALISDGEEADVAFRVIADHLRAICFSIADGQLPANTGAGYVIRRILRRAARHYYTHLNYPQPLLFQLVPVLAKQFENVFPELFAQQDFVAKVIREEEEAFLRTLEKGLKRIDDIIVNSGGNISGKDAFELYDTYGFPFDLTGLIASERKCSVDSEGFQTEMQAQKYRSRKATATDTGDWSIVNKDNHHTVFVGYDSLESEAEMLRYRKVSAKGKQIFQIVLDKTPFYAESGGQVGDSGKIIFQHSELPVIDTKKENDLIIHYVETDPSRVDGKLIASVDIERRNKTALHHTATHLLHAALRTVLGKHVAQKGSLVTPDYLRFDFSHFSKLSSEDLLKVEKLVNEKIRQNVPVVIEIMNKEEAMSMGATALFGEKYGDQVRVVIMDPAYSIELCGGTHVMATGSIGLCKIVSEVAVGAGVRRIEAICGEAAEKQVYQYINELQQLKDVLKSSKNLPDAVQNLIEENATLKREIAHIEQRQLYDIKKSLRDKFKKVNGTHFIGEKVDVRSIESLKKLAMDLKINAQNHLITLAAIINGKVNVVVATDDEFTKQKGLDSIQIIKLHVAPLIKGGGGGQKNIATAGGQDANSLEEVLNTVESLL